MFQRMPDYQRSSTTAANRHNDRLEKLSDDHYKSLIKQRDALNNLSSMMIVNVVVIVAIFGAILFHAMK